MTRETTVPRWEVEHERFGTPTMVVPASAYDALLAEMDALKESLALEREQVELGEIARNALHDEVQAYMKEKRAIEDALRAELAEERAAADRLAEALQAYFAAPRGEQVYKAYDGLRAAKAAHDARRQPADAGRGEG